ncbi:MFS transporter [Arthrobacter sp. KNU40]|uniref:MFS transporter n=1 Tax=Arthrobacter sp. KNU40 TaxID=3447965 RepID=UPI003F5DD413
MTDTALHEAKQARRSRPERKAFMASLLGSTLEYYDFFIYGSAAALVFNHIFFDATNPAMAAIASLATFGVAYLARPIGGIILGHFGDKLGRKKILMLTVLMMGAATVVIGLLPTYEQVGIWAPAGLVLLRVVQGISAGGESSGAISMTLETAPQTKRGFFTSSAVMGSQSGIALGTLVFLPISSLPTDQLLSWGWRVPFLLSAIVVFLAWWFRRSLEETPEFTKTVKRDQIAKAPVVQVVKGYWRQIICVIVVQLWGAMSPMFSVFVLAYATSMADPVSRPFMLAMSTVVVGLAVLTIPLIATISDRIGRKPVLLFGAVGGIGSIFLLFNALNSGNLVFIVVGALINYTVFMAIFNAIWPSFFGEMFPTEIRYSGLALSMQIGLLIPGFTPAILGALVPPGGSNWMPAAIFMSVLLFIAGIGVASAKETSTTPTADLGKRG